MKMEEEKLDVRDIRKLQEAARNASAYYREKQSFQRNVRLTRLVHATFSTTQFLTGLTIELFHQLYYYILKRIYEEAKDVVPEEKCPAFYVYPCCLFISLVSIILWCCTKLLERHPGKAANACFIGAILMLTGGLFAMHDAEIQINLNLVSDTELPIHPIYIHNFTLCILSIFGMTLYLIQAWILFDSWRWAKKRKLKFRENLDTEMHPEEFTTSVNKDVKDPEEFKPVPILKDLQTYRATITVNNPQKEPVILYCCCVDLWNYIKQSRVQRPTHEFRVVHIM